jgi:protein-disulfide isomerase
MPTFSRPVLVSALAVTASVAFAGGALASAALFRDVPSDHWAASAIASVQEAGIMKGSDGLFRPNAAVSRAELAVVVDRLLDRMDGGGDAPVYPTPQPAYEPAGADDDMALGKADAPVTIVEFSDYECPFCARFHKDAFPSIKKDYIDAGKVRFVYRDFPLSFHPAAYPAAVAVECAHAQGNAYAWKLHDAIFANQDELATDTDATLKAWAHAVAGLDDAAFDTCFDEQRPADEIDGDIAAGEESGVSGTPAFWLFNAAGDSQKIDGAVPYSQFQAAIDALLD